MIRAVGQYGLFHRVATVREKVLENEKISRSGKSQGITFSVREIKKNEKSHGKVKEFRNFPKKMLVNRLLKILVSIKFASNIRKGMFLNINCKQFMFRNIPF